MHILQLYYPANPPQSLLGAIYCVLGIDTKRGEQRQNKRLALKWRTSGTTSKWYDMPQSNPTCLSVMIQLHE